MSVIEVRVCDQCSTQYTNDNPVWMTLAFPNIEREDTEFDFCTYQCLQSWVNEDDDELPAATEEAFQAAIDHEKAQLAMQPMQPTMTLAEAIVNGLKPGNPV